MVRLKQDCFHSGCVFGLPQRPFIAKTIVLLLFINTSFWCQSQNNHLGIWHSVNTEIILDSKWSIFGEGQLRSQRFGKEYFFHEYNSSINYKPKKSISIVAGFSSNSTYSNGGSFKKPLANQENRLWEQIAFIHTLSRLRVEHRYRIEQRWRLSGYRNRYRIRLGGILPINKPSIEKGVVFTTFNNEIFFSENKPYLELYRFSLGCGYQLSKPVRFVVSYINQKSYSASNAAVSREFLQAQFAFRINPHLSLHPHHNINPH